MMDIGFITLCGISAGLLVALLLCEVFYSKYRNNTFVLRYSRYTGSSLYTPTSNEALHESLFGNSYNKSDIQFEELVHQLTDIIRNHDIKMLNNAVQAFLCSYNTTFQVRQLTSISKAEYYTDKFREFVQGENVHKNLEILFSSFFDFTEKDDYSELLIYKNAAKKKSFKACIKMQRDGQFECVAMKFHHVV